jgi:hypothetical protein
MPAGIPTQPHAMLPWTLVHSMAKAPSSSAVSPLGIHTHLALLFCIPIPRLRWRKRQTNHTPDQIHESGTT